MGRPRKDAQQAGDELHSDAEHIAEDAVVTVLSQRLGAVLAPCGTLIKHQDVVKVSEDTASWLETTFKGFFKRIK